MSKTKTETRVRTRTEADGAIRTARLTDEEDKVLRMRYGIPLAADVALEMRGQENEETRATLERLEQRAVAASQNGVDAARRNAVIARLRRI